MIALSPVRRLGLEDTEAYRTIRLATLQTEPAFFGTLYAEEAARPPAYFAAVLSESAVFGVFDGPAVVGVVRLAAATGARERHKGSVHGFFVRPERRRTGTGTALMQALLAHARGTLEQLTLSVAAENGGATALYERLGFRRYGVEPRALKTETGYIDRVLMVLRLT